MKSITIIFAIVCTLIYQASATKHTITNSGTSFSPDDISVTLGDTVIFDIADMHDAVEVSKETWDANGNTKNGGFTVPFGGGSVAFNQAGTYYYVCEPHASSGMKGIIRVSAATGIKNTKPVIEGEVYPNPANNYFTITYALKHKADVTISLLNMTGKTIAVIYQGEQTSGNQLLDYDINKALPSGIYFVKITTDEGLLVKKVIVAKGS